jgi:hypothetical protein
VLGLLEVHVVVRVLFIIFEQTARPAVLYHLRGHSYVLIVSTVAPVSPFPLESSWFASIDSAFS